MNPKDTISTRQGTCPSRKVRRCRYYRAHRSGRIPYKVLAEAELRSRGAQTRETRDRSHTRSRMHGLAREDAAWRTKTEGENGGSWHEHGHKTLLPAFVCVYLA